jgi:toxin ParE1/3/4
MQVKWLRRTLANLDQEAAYVARDDPGAAAALMKETDEFTRLLTRHPNSGRPGCVPGTRELVLPHFPYILPCRVREQRVEILRVFHASRKWLERFDR